MGLGPGRDSEIRIVSLGLASLLNIHYIKLALEGIFKIVYLNHLQVSMPMWMDKLVYSYEVNALMSQPAQQGVKPQREI